MYATLQRSAQLGILASEFATIKACNEGPRRDATLNKIVNRLGLMHGLPQKIGQLLAFSEIESSEENFLQLTESELEQTTDKELKAIENLLGDKLENLFIHFETEAISASIGKVHRAATKDGQIVAVKVQHPGVAEALNFDLKALGWITSPIGNLKRDLDINAYRQEIGASLKDELNYNTEAKNIRDFTNQINRHNMPLVIPQVIEPLSNKRILTTTWIAGNHLSDASNWDLADRQQLSNTLVSLFTHGTFDWGMLHADPHPGNYRFIKKNKQALIGLLDFGCVKRIPNRLKSGLQHLLKAAISERLSTSEVLPIYEQMGFNMDALSPMEDKLAEISYILTKPFVQNEAFDVSKWDLSNQLKHVLGSDRMSFRAAGPSELIFILRSFQGLLHYLKILDAPVQWRSKATEITRHCTPLSLPNNPIRSSSKMKSETLHIKVEENGEQKVSLVFGAGATDNLKDLVPLELHEKLTAKDINLTDISQKAKASNYTPGDLFSYQENNKNVKIWLQ